MSKNLGIVEGIVLSIGDEVILNDYLFEKPVSCHLEELLSDDFIGKHIALTGTIQRSDETGQPLEIREVSHIEIVKKSPGAFKRVRGLIPWQEGDEPAEVTIRRLRDMD